MRLFVAVEIDDRARQVAETVQHRLQVALNSTLEARWVPVENMHLTVRFIGHVDDSRAPAIIEALVPPLAVAPFDVELGGCGAFPPRGGPRVLWIGVMQGLTSLALLHDALNRRLLPYGFEPEARPFSAHLTLARVKAAPRGAGRAVQETVTRVRVPAARFQVRRATVFQSHLSPKGPRYDPVTFIPLAGDP